MKSGQFVRGKIDGIQKHFESPDLDKILPADKLSILTDYTDIGEYSRFFTKELVDTKTIVMPAENSDGRRGGIINFTVLQKHDAIIIHENEQYVFDVDTYIQLIREGRRRIKMPEMPALPDNDSGLIDPPPPVEYEEVGS